MPTTLTPGDIAIIGIYTAGSSGGNSATNDGFAFVTLAPIDTGTDIYFTDNGWSNSPTAGTGTAGFRGVSFYTSGTQVQGPAGNEGLIKLTTNSTIAAGTVIRTTGTSSSYTWTTSGTIGATYGSNTSARSYSYPNLSQTGEQIAVVQSTNSTDPIASANVTPIYQIDTSTGGFTNAVDSNTGAVINSGLSTGVQPLSTTDNTALALKNQSVSAVFNTSSLNSGTKADWLAAIGNTNNWTFATSGDSSFAAIPASVTVNPVPEPMTMFGSLTALAIGAGLKQFRKRFQA